MEGLFRGDGVRLHGCGSKWVWEGGSKGDEKCGSKWRKVGPSWWRQMWVLLDGPGRRDG